MEYVTGKELLKKFQKHEIIILMNEKKLTPYSPANLKPYKSVIFTAVGGGKFPDNLANDNILPYVENPFSRLYPCLEEILFDSAEVGLLQSNKLQLSGPAAASKERGEETKRIAESVLKKYGGIDRYMALPRGKKGPVKAAIAKEILAKDGDTRQVDNILNKLKKEKV